MSYERVCGLRLRVTAALGRKAGDDVGQIACTEGEVVSPVALCLPRLTAPKLSRRRSARYIPLLVLACALVGLPACWETINNSTPPGSTSQTQTSHLPAPGTSASPSVAPVGQCAAVVLTVAAAQPSASMPHRSVQLSLGLKPGSGLCTLSGYPTVDFERGVSILQAVPTPRGYMGGLPAQVNSLPTVTLGPGRDAHAVIEGPAVDSAGKQCPTYTDIRVTPPGTSMVFTVSTSLDPL